MQISDLVREEIKRLVPYEANQVECKIKLDANESPYDMPDVIKAEVSRIFSDNSGINLYPDTDSTELRKALSRKWGIDKDMFVVGNGSDQIIQILTNTFIGKGDKVVCPSPSFSMYGLSAEINGGETVEYKMKEENDFEFDVNEFIELCLKNNPKVIYICNPNNPTGGFIPVESVRKVVEACQNSIVVVDEAYNEFVNASCVGLLKYFKNIVILRTFSKAFGLAGVRCGYSMASLEVSGFFNRVRPPYNLNSLTQKVCTITLKYQDLIDEYISKINLNRDWLYENLLKINGIKVNKTYANFILVKIENASLVSQRLLDEGILVRNYGSSSALGNFLRISVGNREQNEALIKSLNKALL